MLTRTEIKSREEFDNRLQEAMAKMAVLVKDIPEDKTLFAVQRQLLAIAHWTEDGRDMTQPQKGRIAMGLQASREMMDFEVEQDLVIALHNYIESRMPTATSSDRL